MSTHRQSGGVIFILVLAMGTVCVCFFLFVLMVAVLMAGANPDDAGMTGGAAAAATWTSDGTTNQVPMPEDSIDLRSGGLKCISLPGVKGTPAVDRRIYPWLKAANRDVTSEGLPQLTYNWLFRTNAQQAAIKSTYGPKAPVNSSYHEAGAAIDVGGLAPGGRSDRFQIVRIFAAHKATWLGGGARPDWPHFQWNFDVLGEPSKYQMIRRAQEAYNRGDVEGNCLGGNRNN